MARQRFPRPPSWTLWRFGLPRPAARLLGQFGPGRPSFRSLGRAEIPPDQLAPNASHKQPDPLAESLALGRLAPGLEGVLVAGLAAPRPLQPAGGVRFRLSRIFRGFFADFFIARIRHNVAQP